MNRKSFYILLVIFLIFIFGIIFYFCLEKKEMKNNNLKNQEQSENLELDEKEKKEESDNILEKINKLVILPEEEPIVSRIADIDQPALNQAFFIGAQNGDYLLIYKNTGKAILYSAKENKILNMGPFSTGE